MCALGLISMIGTGHPIVLSKLLGICSIITSVFAEVSNMDRTKYDVSLRLYSLLFMHHHLGRCFSHSKQGMEMRMKIVWITRDEKLFIKLTFFIITSLLDHSYKQSFKTVKGLQI